MSEQARIRVSLSAGELEVEGSESFVGEYAEAIEALLSRLKTERVSAVVPATPGTRATAAPGGSASSAGAELPEFGEFLHGFSNNATGTDRILAAGWYVQRENSENTFSTNEANQLLIGQGVKLSNPSQSLKQAIAAKRAFKVGGRFRISKIGEEHITSLLGH